MKKKMYSCIIVVGGGLKFECAQPWLQYCIWKSMPAHIRPMLETMDVITRPKVTFLVNTVHIVLRDSLNGSKKEVCLQEK